MKFYRLSDLKEVKKEGWEIKAITDLEKIISSQCKESYLQINRQKDGSYYKEHMPYSVPSEALEAIEYKSMLMTTTPTTKEQEEAIKAFLIPFRTFRVDEVGIK